MSERLLHGKNDQDFWDNFSAGLKQEVDLYQNSPKTTNDPENLDIFLKRIARWTYEAIMNPFMAEDKIMPLAYKILTQTLNIPLDQLSVNFVTKIMSYKEERRNIQVGDTGENFQDLLQNIKDIKNSAEERGEGILIYGPGQSIKNVPINKSEKGIKDIVSQTEKNYKKWGGKS